jgi:hypothetical protein
MRDRSRPRHPIGRRRLYRGPCRSVDEFEAAAAVLREKRPAIVALVDGLRDLDAGARADMKTYLDRFFRTIERPASIKRQFVDGCTPLPTM